MKGSAYMHSDSEETNIIHIADQHNNKTVFFF